MRDRDSESEVLGRSINRQVRSAMDECFSHGRGPKWYGRLLESLVMLATTEALYAQWANGTGVVATTDRLLKFQVEAPAENESSLLVTSLPFTRATRLSLEMDSDFFGDSQGFSESNLRPKRVMLWFGDEEPIVLERDRVDTTPAWTREEQLVRVLESVRTVADL